MSKVIGITPGPVEFTNLDSEDLAEINQFEPTNTGSEGQVLTKGSSGYEWDDVNQFSPASTGSTGQVLTKTESGYDWATASGIPNALIYETTSFDCPTNDSYQGNIPIDPEQTQAGSICIELECVAQTLNADSEVIASHSNSAYVTLSNNNGDMGGIFVGTTTKSVLIKIDEEDAGHFCMASFEVTLTPENQQGTIIYNTTVEVNLLVPYSYTNDGAYTHRFVASSSAPTILSGCTNAEY